jgi:hypothetical protein
LDLARGKLLREKIKAEAKKADLLDWLLAIDASVS